MARFLLIHGACHGAWCWRDVSPLLEAAGHEVIALDMPGRGVNDDRPAAELTLADQVDVILNAIGDGAILVGHSAGGFSISAAAQAAPDKVQRLVYVAALLPQDGDSVTGAMRALEGVETPPPLAKPKDRSRYLFDASQAGTLLYNGVPEADAAWALERICPEPVAPHVEPIRLGPAFDDAPKDFILCTEDRVIPAVDQRRMAEAGGAAIAEIETGHSPFLSTPVRLADHLLKLSA